MKALVLGATGAIGKDLVEQLLKLRFCEFKVNTYYFKYETGAPRERGLRPFS